VKRWIIFHPEAVAELNDGVDYFEQASAGLGNEFMTEIERSLQQIKSFPEASPLIRNDIRRKVLKKFPFSILYNFNADRISILAVMHHRRRPFYWRKRV
jgi:toxin ParE1/3/4